MGLRREGREAAIQLLYQRDLNSASTAGESVNTFWQIRAASDGVRDFCNDLAQGVIINQEEVDRVLIRHVDNYEMHRVATVDRNILRLAIYEMMFRPDIPPVVSINEAIELAKSLGSPESGRFVNGVLDRVRNEIDRPPRTAR